MTYRLQKPALLLAALLQLLPLVRNFVANPAVANSFAFILRWGIGAGAVLGSVDAVSGATSVFTTPTSFSGAVGNTFSNKISCTIGGGNTASSSDYFQVAGGGATSPTIANGASSTVGLPAGLKFTSSWVNNSSTIGGYISGTPTTAGSYPITVTVVSPGNASLAQAITITISGSTTPTAPAITAPPAAASVAAGKTATFTVTASGIAPLGYFWLKNGTALANGGNISGANTATLAIASVAATDAGNYSVTVSNVAGTVTSAAAALSVILPPSITTQPVAQTQAVGASANFSVTATGTAPLAYRWLKNNVAVTNGVKFIGANSNLLVIAALTTADAGSYSVAITNLAGSVTSSVAPITVVSAPSITTPPASVAVVSGGSANFTVTASGSTPLTYQWLKAGSPLANGGNISGATTATLTISPATSADAAGYSVIVSNALGTATSPAATLTVAVPPAIVTAPTSATVIAGTNISFAVTASGTATLTYQWLKNNAVISGATSATLTLNNVSAADAANYSVTVTNAVGSVTSAAATLTVLVPPAISSQPASASITLGNPASFSVTATGTAPLVFQWLKNGTPISGANASVLSFAAVTTNDAASYSVTITNIVGGLVSSSATLTVLVPPTIVTPPTSATVVAGSNTTFTVVAAGSGTLTYQWLKNGTTIPGATSATLTLNNVSSADAANYSVTVANANASITSSAATLTVLVAPAITAQPASVSVVQGNPATFTAAASGTAPLVFQWLKNGTPIFGANSNILSLAAVTTNDAANYSVTVTNTVGNTASSSATLTVLVPPTIVTAPVGTAVVAGGSATFSITAAGTAPLTYQWLKNNAAISGATSATLTLNNVSAASAANYSVTVANAAGSVTSAATALTVNLPPAITAQPANQFGAVGSVINLSVTASGTGPLSYQWFNAAGALADGGNISGSASATLTITALTANEVGNYFVVVSNAFGSVTSATAAVSVNVPPSISSQPVNQTVTVGGNATFSVTASGSGSLAYQWFKNGTKIANATGIAGATTATLSLTTVTTNSAGNYTVTVTNLYGNATSAAAALTVQVPPGITTQPISRTVAIGSNVTFTVNATGTAPLNYQWFKDGSALADGGNISGSATAALTVSGVSTNDAGNYSVTVSNPVGSTNSANAALAVIAPTAAPVILTQPTSLTIAVGATANFNVTASGANLRYQWLKNGKKIAGATNFTYTIVNAKTNNSGNFSVTVTNAVGKVTSTAATLTVAPLPAFAAQPVSHKGTNGYTTKFTAKLKVKGPLPISYQWFKDGTALVDNAKVSGSQSNVLIISNLRLTDAGAYSVKVSNRVGSVTSSNATLTVVGHHIENDNVSFLSNLLAGKTVTKSVAVTAQAVFGAVPAAFDFSGIVRNADGSFSLTGTGPAGSNCVVQASADLTAWNNIATNTIDAGGQWQMTDTTRANIRFYRLKTAP